MQRFRVATAEDVDAIIDMMRGYYREDGYAFVEAEAREAVLALIRDEQLGRLWVAREQSRAVGYLAVALGFSLECRGRDAFIDELFVSEAHRGRGLGREAIQIAEAYCLGLGVKALYLEVERHRKHAHEIYLRAGFQSKDRHLLTKLLPDSSAASA